MQPLAPQYSVFQSAQQNGSSFAKESSSLPSSTNIPGQVQSLSQEIQLKATESNPDIQNALDTQVNAANAVPNDAQVPTTPHLDKTDSVQGYENAAFDEDFCPQPPSDHNEREQQEILTEDFPHFPTLTKEEAREALLLFTGEHCCYGSQAAINMTLNSIQNKVAFHYILQTFSERRETHWAYEPHSNSFSARKEPHWVYEPFGDQTIDSPENELVPETSNAVDDDSGVNNVVFIEVPHTASVKPCHNCEAIGKEDCNECSGRGRISCSQCSGSGRSSDIFDEQCSRCSGCGRVTCHTCKGCGEIVCLHCEGKLQLKWFIQLKSTWNAHLVDYIIDRTQLPDDLIRTVTGKVIFEENAPRVWPINHFSDDELNYASFSCIQQHRAIQDTERVISQRHKIRIIPVAQVNCTWKEKEDEFIVYGLEKKVYWPNYPQRVCWRCNIL